MDKKTKQMLMIVGVAVGAYLIYRMVRKDTASKQARTQDITGTSPGMTSPEEGPFNPIDYAKNEFGVDDATAEQIASKANTILNQPDGKWYKQTEAKAQERGRTTWQQALHEAWWVIDSPNRKVEYVENTWGLNAEQAQELIAYTDEKILPNESWHQDTVQRANERGRDVWQQLLHEAHWQLYDKENAKYAFTG